jgi:hypothetical protein
LSKASAAGRSGAPRILIAIKPELPFGCMLKKYAALMFAN